MLPLEDHYGDVISKAMLGLGLTDLNLSQATKLGIDEVRAARRGQFNEPAAHKLAKALRLNAAALIGLGNNSYHPGIRTLPAGLAALTSHFGSMTVNAYLIWDLSSRQACLFDTGTDPELILDRLQVENLQLESIFITHSHGDHIDCLPQIQQKTSAAAWIHRHGDIGGVQLFDWGQSFAIGKLQIVTRETTGHAADGTTFVIAGLDCPVAVVGDALFAASMGGGKISYPGALETNRRSIYSLPDDTLLCPGHGPVTRVGLEKTNNPFYLP